MGRTYPSPYSSRLPDDKLVPSGRLPQRVQVFRTKLWPAPRSFYYRLLEWRYRPLQENRIPDAQLVRPWYFCTMRLVNVLSWERFSFTVRLARFTSEFCYFFRISLIRLEFFCLFRFMPPRSGGGGRVLSPTRSLCTSCFCFSIRTRVAITLPCWFFCCWCAPRACFALRFRLWLFCFRLFWMN